MINYVKAWLRLKDDVRAKIEKDTYNLVVWQQVLIRMLDLEEDCNE